MTRVDLTDQQREAFRKLWFVYGNHGAKSTLFNHKLIQGFYEYSENRIEEYKDGFNNMLERYGFDYAVKHGVTLECINECKKILNNISTYINPST